MADQLLNEDKKQARFFGITVEPALFLFAVAGGIGAPPYPAFVFRKVCLNHYNYAICDNLTSSASNYTSSIEKMTSHLLFLDNVAYAAPTFITIFLFGSWSDHIGRRPIMAMASFGLMISPAVYVPLAIFMESPAYLITVGSVFVGMCGGSLVLGTAAYSYINDITDPENRSTRLAILGAVTSLAGVIASLSSGWILEKTGFVFIYSLVGILSALGFLYIVFVLKEPQKNQKSLQNDMSFNALKENEDTSDNDVQFKDLNLKKKLKMLFSPHHMKDALLVTFRSRPGRSRQYIILLFLVSFTYVFADAVSVSYLYLTYPPISMNQIQYSAYVAFTGFVFFLAQLLVLPTMKRYLGLSDEIILLIGMGCDMLARLYMGLCRTVWMVFLQPFIGFFAAFIMICIRSLLPLYVEADEVGKIYSALAWVQTLGFLCCSFLFSGAIYPLTFEIYSGLAFIISGIMTIVPLSIAIIYTYRYKKYGGDASETFGLGTTSQSTVAEQANEILDQLQIQ